MFSDEIVSTLKQTYDKQNLTLVVEGSFHKFHMILPLVKILYIVLVHFLFLILFGKNIFPDYIDNRSQILILESFIFASNIFSNLT